jgi:hypothetical protein
MRADARYRRAAQRERAEAFDKIVALQDDLAGPWQSVAGGQPEQTNVGDEIPCPGSPVASLVDVTRLPAWVNRRCLDARAAATGPGVAPARSVTGPMMAKEAGTPVRPPMASMATSASPMPASTSASTAPAFPATRTWCAHPAAMNGRSFSAARSIRCSAGPATKSWTPLTWRTRWQRAPRWSVAENRWPPMVLGLPYRAWPWATRGPADDHVRVVLRSVRAWDRRVRLG